MQDLDEHRPASGKTFSRFGGLWIDRDDWQTLLKNKLESGSISPETASNIEIFLRDGYIVFEKAVPTELTARLREELEEFWRNPPEDSRMSTHIDGKRVLIKADIQHRDKVTKLLDYHAFSENARAATAAPRVVEFLTAIFDSKPKAFQSLTFWKGSQQAIHKDTAYVQIDGAPMIMVATWLALEDIEQGTGELEYYVGSHRGPEYLFGGEHKWKKFARHEHQQFLDSLHEDAKKYGFKKESFLAKEGDVLIWHADLAHGGSKIQKPGRTRQSLVTHFTAASHEPPYQKKAQRTPVEYQGVLFIAQHKQI